MSPLLDGYGDVAVRMLQAAVELFVVKKNKNNKTRN
jgi:hypothetical protein